MCTVLWALRPGSQYDGPAPDMLLSIKLERSAALEGKRFQSTRQSILPRLLPFLGDSGDLQSFTPNKLETDNRLGGVPPRPGGSGAAGRRA